MATTVTTDHKWLQLDDDTIGVYNAWDTVTTARLAKSLRGVLNSNQQFTYYQEELWPALPAIARMQHRGLPYDTQLKGHYRKALRRELREVDEELRTAFKETADLTHAQAASAWQLVSWLVLPGLPGWFKTPASKTLKSGKVKRRPEPFTKGEWTKLARYFPQGFNPNSDDQVRSWLFETLGLRPSTHTEGGKPSVDMDALNRILQRKPRTVAEGEAVERAKPVLHNLMHRSKLAKVDEDYLDPPIAEDGRVHPTIKMNRAVSGRNAWAEPPVHSWATTPKFDIAGHGRVGPRHLVKAPPGKLILGCDYRAIEARIFALESEDQADLHIFEQNRLDPHNKEWDIHIRRSCDLFDYSFADFMAKEGEAQKTDRDLSKSFTYGVIQYGGEAETVKSKVSCPCHRCPAPASLNFTPQQKRRLADRWFRRHPNANAMREWISDQVRRHHRLQNRFGMVRFFHDPWSDAQKREAWNWWVQPAATCVLRRAMVRLDKEGAPLILEHHDALYMEIEESELPKWAKVVTEIMELPVPEYDGFVFPSELEVGPSWGEMEEYHG